MWAREQADFGGLAAGALVAREDGGCEGADTAFALCAGYVDDVEAVEVVGLDLVARVVDQRSAWFLSRF